MRYWLTAGVLGAWLSSGAPVFAQQLDHFDLNRFQPAPAGDRFFGVQGADRGFDAALPVMVLGDYAYRPLVLYRNDGDDRVGSVISDQLYVHGAVALGLWKRLVLSVDVPFAIVTEGDSPSSGGLTISSPSGASLGDVRGGARVRLLGAARGPLQLALGGYVWFPTGDRDRFTSEGKVRGQPALVVSGETGHVAYALNAGVTLRPERHFAGTQISNDFAFGGALALLLAERKLQLGPELYGSTTFNDAFKRDTTNLEGILGAKVQLGPIVLGAGAGPGFTRGLGTPSLRALLSVAVVPQIVEREAVRDRDHDGVLDEADACPDVPGSLNDDPKKNGCPDDRDGDGILDKDDACPDVPGKADPDPKKNGCPSDRDGDRIADNEDACPDVVGVPNSDPKKNGCPPDRDGDGIADLSDACPDVPGKADPDPKKNGCPPDTDGDGITDDQDACPRERGKPDPDPQKNGCPSMVRVTAGEIAILQQVQFKTASDVILPESDELLEQVAAVLREHPEITKIEVQGHTDNRGAPAYNKRLSQRRAQSVVKWLVSRGQLSADRLVAKGYGMDQPLTDNNTEEGRQKNRRVQFKIVDKSDADQTTEGAQ